MLGVENNVRALCKKLNKLVHDVVTAHAYWKKVVKNNSVDLGGQKTSGCSCGQTYRRQGGGKGIQLMRRYKGRHGGYKLKEQYQVYMTEQNQYMETAAQTN